MSEFVLKPSWNTGLGGEGGGIRDCQPVDNLVFVMDALCPAWGHACGLVDGIDHAHIGDSVIWPGGERRAVAHGIDKGAQLVGVGAFAAGALTPGFAPGAHRQPVKEVWQVGVEDMEFPAISLHPGLQTK